MTRMERSLTARRVRHRRRPPEVTAYEWVRDLAEFMAIGTAISTGRSNTTVRRTPARSPPILAGRTLDALRRPLPADLPGHGHVLLPRRAPG